MVVHNMHTNLPISIKYSIEEGEVRSGEDDSFKRLVQRNYDYVSPCRYE